MPIFVFVDFSVLLLLWFLCCFVVKLGKAKKKEIPKKVEVLPGISTRQVMVACAKVIVSFCWVVLLFFLVSQEHYKNSFLMILTC